MPFDRLFIRAGGQSYGPFTIEQIAQAILERRLTPSHEVSPDGETWFAAGTIWNEIRPIVPGPPDVDDSHRRRRRRRSSEGSAGEARPEPSSPRGPPNRDDTERAGTAADERSGTPPATPPYAAAPPSTSPPPPPLPPRPNVASSPSGPPPSALPPSRPSPSGPSDPPETVAVPKIDPKWNATVPELDLSDSSPAQEVDRSTSRRRRRSGSHRSGGDADADNAAYGGKVDGGGMPTISGVATRVSLAVFVLLLIAELVAAIYLFMSVVHFREYLADLTYGDVRPTKAEIEAVGRSFGEAIDERYQIRRIVIAVTLGFWVLSATLFLIWKYGVNVCLRRSGVTGLRFTPGGCVGWYFVPIANLFKPYRAMREMWIAADPYSYDRRRSDSAGWVAAWWAIGILGGIACLIAYFALVYTSPADDRFNALYQELHFEPFLIAYGLLSAVVLFILITKLSNRLTQKIAADAAYRSEG